MKLQILSNGTVSLNGIRITKSKMYGISTVLEEFNVDKKAIENIIQEEYDRSRKVFFKWRNEYDYGQTN